MADIVRDILDKSIRQRKVIFQQKKPLLNYELNLAQDILKESLEEFTRVSIGDNFSGESFQVDPGPATAEIFIRKGTFYHKGTPLSLTADIRISNPTLSPPGSGIRYDLVYALWRINQSDSPADPVIGFSTTQEQHVELEIIYEAGTSYPTNVPSETITFSSTDNSISLTRGQFPDWMRIQGTRFKTNAILNNGAVGGYFTLASSPNDKKIIVEETITDQVASDVRFTQYLASLEIPKEFRAFRDNVVILAVIERVAGNFVISKQYVHDMRPGMANNYVAHGCAPYRNGIAAALEIGFTPGEYSVGGDKEFLEEGTVWKIAVANDSFNYVYLTSGGELATSTTEPTGFHVMLAEVQAVSGVITHFKDVRQFRPASYSGSESEGSGEALTGFNSVSHNFTAGEAILAYDLVYQDSDAKARKTSASTKLKLPAIGIATQATALNQKNTFVTYGIISNPSWSWVAGEDLFADSASGKIINSASVSLLGNGQYVQRIGVALSQKEIFFKPELCIIKKDTSAELALIKLTEAGDLEVMGSEDRISPDRLSFLATTVTSPTISQGVNILAGRYFVEGSLARNFAGQFINMGVTGTTYKTKAIPTNFYNKAFFTLDRDGVVKMYEGTASNTIPTVDPVVPDGELPLSVITFRDNGAGIAGSIASISATDIADKRPWLNMGSVEDSAFQAIYRSTNSILVQQGEAWFSKKYITLAQNEEITVSTVTDGTYYFYLNLENLSNNEAIVSQAVSASDFLGSDKLPSQLPRRDYILLAQYDVASGSILPETFKTFKSRFWDFQDIPFFGERIYDITSTKVAGDPFDISDSLVGLGVAFNFEDRDFLEVTINGTITYEGEDYSKTGTGNSNFVTFLYDIPVGAEVRIRKV